MGGVGAMVKRSAFVVVAVALLVGCVPAKPPDRKAAEQHAVYSVVLQRYVGSGTRQLVISNETSATMIGSEPITSFAALEMETLNDFSSRCDTRVKLQPNFLLTVPYVLVGEEELDRAFGKDGSWDRFYKRYPQSRGVITLSYVGFNTKFTQALVYVRDQFASLGGGGVIMFLMKKNGIWTVEGTDERWIS